MIATAGHEVQSSPPRTVLAIRFRQLGDALATLGTLRAIKRSAPMTKILFVVDRPYHRLLEKANFIDELLPAPPPFNGVAGGLRYNEYVDRLRQRGIDCVLDFHSNTRSAVLSYLSGAPMRVGFDVRVRKIFYTDVEPRAYFRDGQRIPRTSHSSAMDLARRGRFDHIEGVAVDTLTLSNSELLLAAQLLRSAGIPDNADIVGINPGNPYPAKEWPREYFVQLATMLVAARKAVLVHWGPSERERAQWIVDAAGAGTYLAPAVDLAGTPALLKHLSSLVTIDSGLKHLAVAVGVPTVTLFGPTNPDEWHMGGDLDRIVTASMPCSPCRLKECHFGTPCMTRLTPKIVANQVVQIHKGWLGG